MAVEAEDFRDSVLAHDRDVDSVSCRQITVADDDFPSTLDDREVHRQHFVDDLEKDVEARLNCIAVVDGDVTMEDLLKDLGIGDEPTSLSDCALQQTTSVDFVRMLGAHQIHGDVGVDQDL